MMTNLPRRRRTPRLSRDERRSQLIETAALLFSESSFGGVTTALLAATAGVTEPVLYQHFASKLQLYHTILEESTNRTLAQWLEIAELSESPIDAIFNLMRAQIDTEGELWTYFKILTRAVSQAGEPGVSEILSDSTRRYHIFLKSLLERAKEAGELPADLNASDVAWTMTSQCLMLNYAHQIGLEDLSKSGALERQLKEAFGLASRSRS